MFRVVTHHLLSVTISTKFCRTQIKSTIKFKTFNCWYICKYHNLGIFYSKYDKCAWWPTNKFYFAFYYKKTCSQKIYICFNFQMKRAGSSEHNSMGHGVQVNYILFWDLNTGSWNILSLSSYPYFRTYWYYYLQLLKGSLVRSPHYWIPYMIWKFCLNQMTHSEMSLSRILQSLSQRCTTSTFEFLQARLSVIQIILECF